MAITLKIISSVNRLFGARRLPAARRPASYVIHRRARRNGDAHGSALAGENELHISRGSISFYRVSPWRAFPDPYARGGMLGGMLLPASVRQHQCLGDIAHPLETAHVAGLSRSR